MVNPRHIWVNVLYSIPGTAHAAGRIEGIKVNRVVLGPVRRRYGIDFCKSGVHIELMQSVAVNHQALDAPFCFVQHGSKPRALPVQPTCGKSEIACQV